MFRRAFLVPALERAVKSAAQAVVGLILGDLGFDVWQADWRKALGVAAGAAILSLLTSVASYQAGPTGSPSLVADPQAAPVAGEHRATKDAEDLADRDVRVHRLDREARDRDPLT